MERVKRAVCKGGHGTGAFRGGAGFVKIFETEAKKYKCRCNIFLSLHFRAAAAAPTLSGCPRQRACEGAPEEEAWEPTQCQHNCSDNGKRGMRRKREILPFCLDGSSVLDPSLS